MAIPEVAVQYRVMSVGGHLHEHIIRIGGNSPRWEKSREEVIDDIENARCNYYVQGSLLLFSHKAYVYMVKPNWLAPSTWFLRTYADDTLANNLLSLPNYPSPQNSLASFLKT